MCIGRSNDFCVTSLSVRPRKQLEWGGRKVVWILGETPFLLRSTLAWEGWEPNCAFTRSVNPDPPAQGQRACWCAPIPQGCSLHPTIVRYHCCQGEASPWVALQEGFMGVGIKHKWKTHEVTSPTQAPPLCAHWERQPLERGWLLLTKSSEFLLPSPHPWGFFFFYFVSSRISALVLAATPTHSGFCHPLLGSFLSEGLRFRGDIEEVDVSMYTSGFPEQTGGRGWGPFPGLAPLSLLIGQTAEAHNSVMGLCKAPQQGSF